MPRGQGKRKPVPPSRWSRRLSDTPGPAKSGAMLVVVTDDNGTLTELYCAHPLLSGFVGKQRPLAKFLTKSLVRKLQQCVPVSNHTTYNKKWDRKLYKHTVEPEGGDLDDDELGLVGASGSSTSRWGCDCQN